MRAISPEALLRSLNSLESASQGLNAASNIAEVMQQILFIVLDTLVADRALVYLRDEVGGTPLTASKHLSNEYVSRVKPQIDTIATAISPGAGQLFVSEVLCRAST